MQVSSARPLAGNATCATAGAAAVPREGGSRPPLRRARAPSQHASFLYLLTQHCALPPLRGFLKQIVKHACISWGRMMTGCETEKKGLNLLQQEKQNQPGISSSCLLDQLICHWSVAKFRPPCAVGYITFQFNQIKMNTFNAS